MKTTALWIPLFVLLSCQGHTCIPAEQETTDIGQRMKPNKLILSGTNVFLSGERTHDVLKNVFVVVKCAECRKIIDLTVETKFTAGQGITWCPLRSSRLPEYRFNGNWEMEKNGEISITGKYKPSNGPAELPLRLQKEKQLGFVVTEVILRAGAPPYTHTLELYVRRSESEISNKTDAGDGK